MPDYLRTWAEISLDAVESNVEALKARLAPGVKLMCVIKADAYGHGAVPLARFLDGKCDFYAVSVLEEALTLRAAGVAKPMLLLCYTSPGQYGALLAANVAQTVYAAGQARALSQAAREAGKRQKVHIAVDTGMARIGFGDTDISVDEIAQIARLPGLELEGLFTHYARADEADLSSALAQQARFTAFAGKLEAAGVRIPLKHSCNSAAAMGMEGHGDIVRFGIGLYGLYPSEAVSRDVRLAPAMSWKTHVAHLKTVPAGTGVSYGHTFVAGRETAVATLPVGYADGYPRALSNRGRVIIHGRYAPIIGRVCMDMCMADVTGIPGVRMEDEAVLLGGSGPCRVTMEEIGAWSCSFNYEAACRVSQRVPRVYTYRGQADGFQSVLTTEQDFLAKYAGM
ncbi:MAG: alanine racemase [Oscillospiraceae bacterium]|jgi:alanine racemase|nr:alanine racemase [Oscillospiraceae bacterium]